MNGKLLRATINALCIASALITSAPLWAASAGSGSAFGLQANLSTVPLLGAPTTLTLGPAPSGISGSAPPDFNQSGTVVSISGSLYAGAVSVSSGTLTANTQSTLAANTVTSTASVQNLDLALVIAGLQASAVSSIATATCTANSVVLGGSSNLTGVSICAK